MAARKSKRDDEDDEVAAAVATAGTRPTARSHVSGHQRQSGGSEKRSDGVAEVLSALEQPPEQPALRLRPAATRRVVRRCYVGCGGSATQGT